MKSEIQKANGPAEVAASTPSQVPSKPKGLKNMGSNTTTALCGATYLTETENPWVKSRRLARELADTMSNMDEVDRPAYAMVFPDNSRGYRYGFASSGVSDMAKMKLPVDQVNDLSQELADVLDEYADGQFMAVVLPRSRSMGWPVMFGSIKAQQELISEKAKEATLVDEGKKDPLVAAIKAYLAGLDDFNANAPLDNNGANAYAEKSYLPPMRVLNEWDQPATSLQGSILALQIANRDSGGVYGCEAAERMVNAALGYLQNLNGRPEA